jgi:hypothetical protein
MKLALISILVILQLSGCSIMGSQKERYADQDELSERRESRIMSETHKLLFSIDKSLKILAETRQGKIALNSTPAEMKKREWLFNATPDGMGVPITIPDWDGHPMPVLKMIAGFTGYGIEEIGKPASNVRNINVSYISRPAIEVLRSAATQMGCDGLVDPQSKNRKIVVDWTIRKRGACKQ